MDLGDRTYRKFVGVSGSRGDFVRLQGDEMGTVLAAQVIMFVRLTGFGEISGISIPLHLRNPRKNSSSLDLALVRWLSPHPTALLRDDNLRPVCPPPFDINHALWKFSKRNTRRWTRTTRIQHLFPAPTVEERSLMMETHQYAMYDFVQPQSIDVYMNCTPVGHDPDTFLETITIPFNETTI